MNRLLSTLLCGWALLLYPLYSIAESYELSATWTKGDWNLWADQFEKYC